MNISELQPELELYKYLREEIIESIELQHKTFISESFFISVVFSLGLLQTDSQTSSSLLYNLYNLLILSTPPVIVALSSLWLIEQSRMMRAGGYLQLLENKINKEVGRPCITWENWLRDEDISELDVHKIHHHAQYFIMTLFLGLGIVSIGIMWLLQISFYIKIILTIFYLILIFLLFRLVYKVVLHRKSKVEKKVVESGENAFSKWENGYFEEIKEKGKKE